jgi:pyruvate dehydrogenase (quinone)
MGGAQKFVESQELPDIGYAGFAASLGLNALVVKDPEELADAWRNALSSDRPTVLDVYTDPDMPPIPPHATWEQFKAAATAVLTGDEDRVGFVKVGIKTKAQEFLPHKKKR